MNSMPLWDLNGRTLSLGSSIAQTVEGLLRLSNSKQYQRPITLYILGNPEVDQTLSETLVLSDVIRSLRSRVSTVAMGILSAGQAVALCAGTGRRVVLPHTMATLRALRFKPANAPIGLAILKRDSIIRLSTECQLAALLRGLNVSAQIFEAEQTLTAEQMVFHNLADLVLHQYVQRKEATHERGC